MKDPYISASEIAEYCYCERAWWHRLEGMENERLPELAVGEQKHQAVAAQVVQAQRTQTAGRTLLWVGVTLFVIVVALLVLSPR
jgi:CRISPR/Cas system-associated exonuclease Cas4 (RecB family)